MPNSGALTRLTALQRSLMAHLRGHSVDEPVVQGALNIIRRAFADSDGDGDEDREASEKRGGGRWPADINAGAVAKGLQRPRPTMTNGRIVASSEGTALEWGDDACYSPPEADKDTTTWCHDLAEQDERLWPGGELSFESKNEARPRQRP